MVGRPRLDPDEDARLVERCLAGDARAWEQLVRRHERLVYSVARSYRLSPGDAGDVFQEVFAALVRGLSRIRDARALVRWLASTADRMARATALRRRRELALGLGDDPKALEALADEAGPVETGLEELEARARVRLALASLPATCRRLIEALYYEDPPPSYAELSRRLRTPIGSLGPTRARCLERMRRVLETLESGAAPAPAPAPTAGEPAPAAEAPAPPGPPPAPAAGTPAPTTGHATSPTPAPTPETPEPPSGPVRRGIRPPTAGTFTPERPLGGATGVEDAPSPRKDRA